MKVEKITLQNFKGFENSTFRFNPNVTVLIGNNAAGKSTILDALSFLLGTFFIGVNGVQTRSLKQHEKRVKIYSPQSIEVQLPLKLEIEHSFEGEFYEWYRDTNKATGGSTSYKSASELINRAKELVDAVRTGKDVNLPLIAYYGITRISNERKQRSRFNKKRSRLDGYYGCLDPRTFRERFIDWFRDFEDSALKFGEDKTLYNAFTNTITSMVSNWKKIHYSWSESDMMGKLDDDTWMPFRMLSDGYRNIVRLSADIAYRAISLNPHLGENAVVETEGVVLIDEVDMHLHPKWQKRIIEDLKKTFPKIQFIVTTHSPFIVQSLRADEIINLDGRILDQHPKDLSLEENVLFMGVDDTKSEFFQRKKNIAFEYLKTLENKKSEKEIENKRKQMLSEIDDDPLLRAKLELERLSKLGKNETN